MNPATAQVSVPTIPQEFMKLILLAMLGGMLFWTFELLQPYPEGTMPWTFLDYLNLVIHEAGHLVFGFINQFMGILGGSLMQVLIPLLVTISMFRSNELPGFGFGLFWIGNNLVNISYYIIDATHNNLTLLGGEASIHDWQWLLTEMGVVQHADLIGLIVKVFGAAGLLFGIGLVILSLVASPKESN